MFPEFDPPDFFEIFNLGTILVVATIGYLLGYTFAWGAPVPRALALFGSLFFVVLIVSRVASRSDLWERSVAILGLWLVYCATAAIGGWVQRKVRR
jgi:hypothetical protein